MVTAALIARLVVMGFMYTDQLDPARDHFEFGCETGRIARSIAAGQGFSSPYPEPTGPTALITPVYPYLLAGIFKLFGIYSAASALVSLTLNNLFSALTCLPVFFIARKAFGLRVAAWAGWGWTFFPYAIYLGNRWVWETSLTTLLLSLLVLATMHLERSSQLFAWLGYGALWGLAALTNPAVLSCLPLLWAWICHRQRRRGTRCGGQVVAAALVFLFSVTPWLARNFQTFGHLVVFRSGFFLEFQAGNSNDTGRPAAENLLPADNPAEMEKIRRMGEPAYMAEKQHEAWNFLAHHPGRFAWLTVRRIVCVWTSIWSLHPSWQLTEEFGVFNILTYAPLSLLALWGLCRAFRDHKEYAIPLAILLACFPVIYYVTHPDIRYRHPIDPEIVILAVCGAIRHFGKEWEETPAQRETLTVPEKSLVAS